jgi:hypothetical protein
MFEVRGTSRRGDLRLEAKNLLPQASSEALRPYRVQGETLGQDYLKTET